MTSKALPTGDYAFRLTGVREPAAVRAKVTEAGIDGRALREIRERLGLTIAELARILGAGERTVIRKEQQRSALSATEADRAYRLARIADLAIEAIGDAPKATRWLRAPNGYLGGETPVGMLDTEVGTELVMQSLATIAYGGVA